MILIDGPVQLERVKIHTTIPDILALKVCVGCVWVVSVIHITGRLRVYKFKGEQEWGTLTLWFAGQAEERGSQPHKQFYCPSYFEFHPSPLSPVCFSTGISRRVSDKLAHTFITWGAGPKRKNVSRVMILDLEIQSEYLWRTSQTCTHTVYYSVIEGHSTQLYLRVSNVAAGQSHIGQYWMNWTVNVRIVSAHISSL